MEISFSRKVALLGIGLLLVFAVSFAFGQGISTGSISGTVEDQQHAVIVGAKVAATQEGTNSQFNTVSNSTGYFSLRYLPLGSYTVTVESPKFSKLQIKNVVVNSDRDNSLGARTLSVGAQEVVTVETAAPMVETSSIQVATTFESKKVTDLPINSGSDQLAYLVPGVAPSEDVAFGNTNGAAFQANGQRGRSTNFQIDGQGNNDNSVTGPQLGVTNPDTIAEFQVSTNYTAEYGRNMGAVINVVTKSGTNTPHGTVSYFHTNRLFQSLGNESKSPFLGFCAPGQDAVATGCNPVVKPQFLENRGGFTLGGPFIKDKLWGFGSYQYDVIAQSADFNSGQLLTPTPTGLSQLQAAYPGNPGVAALAAIGPTHYAGATYSNTTLLGFNNGAPIAVCTVGTAGCNAIEFGQVSRSILQPFHEHEWSLRGDYQMTSKDRISARFIRQSNVFTNITASTTADFSAGQVVDVPALAKQIAVDWSRTWTPRLVNQARFSFGKLDVDFQNGSNPGCTVNAPDACPIHIGITTPGDLSFGLGVNLPQGREVNNYQYEDNATYALGRHTLKWGGEAAHENSPSPFLPRFNPDFTFSSFRNLLRNTPSRFRMVDGPFANAYKENDLAFYFQDDWRAKDNLTLNLGLRWEWQQQAINLLHDISTARQASSTPFWNPALPAEFTTVPKYDQDLNNFGPVVGFAWTPRVWRSVFGEDKTVIRGGYEIKYDPSFYNIFLNVSTSAPAVNLGDLRNAAAPGLPATATAFTGTETRPILLPSIPAGCNTVSAAGVPLCDPRYRSQTQVLPGFHNPYTQQWTFSVQRQLSSKIAAEVRYVGNHTIGQFQTVNANPVVGVPGSGIGPEGLGFDGSTPGLANVIPSGVTPCTATSDPFYPGTSAAPPGASLGYADCNHRNVGTRANTAFSLYHGLQTRLDFQNWHGFTANFAYTYSKTIDNASEIFSTFAGGQGIVGSQNPFNSNQGERAVSGFDFPHVFTTAFSYQLPWLKNQPGVIGHILGGWEANTIYRYTSGQAYTPLQFAGTSSSCDPSGTISASVDTCRPILANPNAPLNAVGFCVDNTLPDCGISNAASGDPTTLSAVHWIQNDDTAALFFGNPYLGVGRNTLRGQPVNAVNFGVFKNTKVSERVTVQFQANAYNLFNHQWRGTPDAFVQDVSTTPVFNTFGTNFANPSGNFNANANETGIGIRRLIFGLKVIF